MAIVKTIGKNTIGDNNKMKVAMHEYEMSTMNLSRIFRSTIGVGTLVPCFKELAQKGDIFEVDMRNKTLTHPTLGPLFGSYRLQHYFFFCPFRLYNSWLHNNKLGIGMQMSQIKFPIIGTWDAEMKTKSSSLLNYLGWKGSITKDGVGVRKNAIPLLAYIDIFKNYFANTQEKNFYYIGTYSKYARFRIVTPTVQIPNSEPSESTEYNGTVKLGTFKGTDAVPITNGTTITLQNKGVNNADAEAFLKKLDFYVGNTDQGNDGSLKTAVTLGWTVKGTTIVVKGLNPGVQYLTQIQKGTNATSEIGINDNTPSLETESLETLDDIRDAILACKGNLILELNNEGKSINHLRHYTERGFKLISRIFDATKSSNLGGLFLKTYDSDLYNNWINNEFIDAKASSINNITAVSTEGGSFKLDALNLAEKVYNMLNRIAISGGTYRDWLETVYTAGKYMDRLETPEFIGGMSQMIEFDEVISTSQSQTEGTVNPLGELAGRGYTTGQKGGHIHYKCEEPGYIMGLLAITPMVDYSQGNDWDLNLRTLDDLHKPALDGIGYQDSMNEERAWWTASSTNKGYKDTSAGKVPAWINYHTAVNKTYGNFADGESEDFMVLNRRYQREGENIADLTTYIDPTKHVEIFADTNLDSQNFMLQTAFQVTRRGNYSARLIPQI